jgi:hypothetical protein
MSAAPSSITPTINHGGERARFDLRRESALAQGALDFGARSWRDRSLVRPPDVRQPALTVLIFFSTPAAAAAEPHTAKLELRGVISINLAQSFFCMQSARAAIEAPQRTSRGPALARRERAHSCICVGVRKLIGRARSHGRICLTRAAHQAGNHHFPGWVRCSKSAAYLGRDTRRRSHSTLL